MAKKVAERALLVREQSSVSFLDPEIMWTRLNGIPSRARLRALMYACDVETHDADGWYVKSHRTHITAIGGMPVLRRNGKVSIGTEALTLEDALSALRRSIAHSANILYLNPKDFAADTMVSRGVNLSAASSLPTLTLLIAGLSEGAAAELSAHNELACFSKVATTRCGAQDDPPIVVRDPEHLPVAQKIRELLARIPVEYYSRELRNGFHPLNKATVIEVSGSVSNLYTLAGLIADETQGAELREIGASVKRAIEHLFPEMTTQTHAAA